MNIDIKKRTFIRLISFLIASIIIASAFAYTSIQRQNSTTLVIKHQNMKNVQDLITHTQNINTDLTKALYAKSPALLSQISSKIWREAGLAKDIVAELPIDYIKLQNTTKLLSQVGDYCVSLSKSFARGDTITKEQRDNLAALAKYCTDMTSEAIIVGDEIRTGAISVTAMKSKLGEQETPNIAESFNEFEEGFTAYPTLIYDGPFSDHIMQKEPERLKNEPLINSGKAKELAALASGLPENLLASGEDEKSKMEAYGFTGDGVDVSITKKGGLIATMLKSRSVDESKLAPQEALGYAKKYLSHLGVKSVTESYYEISGNVMTINYAYLQDDVTVYTDLIKVGVALDDGEIVSFDARGYIVNHMKRDIKPPTLSTKVATSKVSEYLKIISSKLCIVPSDGLSEVLCYEFNCKSDDGKNMLVYINANTGMEERILILLIDENGTLTM